MKIVQPEAGSAIPAWRPDRPGDRVPERHTRCFETHRGAALLTFGVLIHLPRHPADTVSAIESRAFAKVALDRPQAAARGKIAVLGSDGLKVFQADGTGRVEPALCGNASAAAALASGLSNGRLALLDSGASRIEVTFSCTGNTVRQGWLLSQFHVREFTFRGRYCVRLRGLNDYVVVTGGLPVGLTAETCRLQLADGNPNMKLAILGTDDMPELVAFHNANGRHGAAPMTGLASLALAAAQLPLFASRLGGTQVTFRTAAGLKSAELPAINRFEDHRLRVMLPDVDVRLTPMTEVTQ